MEATPEAKMVSITQLANSMRKSKTWIRERLKAEEKILERQNSKDYKEFIVDQGGPLGKKYNAEWARNALMNSESATPALDSVFGSKSRFDGVIRTGDKLTTKTGVLAGVLESRYAASQAYDILVRDLIEKSDELCIRVLSGQDFFNSNRPIAHPLVDRTVNKTTKGSPPVPLWEKRQSSYSRRKKEQD